MWMGRKKIGTFLRVETKEVGRRRRRRRRWGRRIRKIHPCTIIPIPARGGPMVELEDCHGVVGNSQIGKKKRVLLRKRRRRVQHHVVGKEHRVEGSKVRVRGVNRPANINVHTECHGRPCGSTRVGSFVGYCHIRVSNPSCPGWDEPCLMSTGGKGRRVSRPYTPSRTGNRIHHPCVPRHGLSPQCSDEKRVNKRCPDPHDTNASGAEMPDFFIPRIFNTRQKSDLLQSMQNALYPWTQNRGFKLLPRDDKQMKAKMSRAQA